MADCALELVGQDSVMSDAATSPNPAVYQLRVVQVRTRVLNNTLTNDYRHWYPGFTHTSEPDTLDDQLVAA